MKLSLVERETILLYNQAEPMAEVYTHDPRLMEKLELLAKKHPDQITRKDAHNFTVPKRCVSVREPYSAERRKAAVSLIRHILWTIVLHLKSQNSIIMNSILDSIFVQTCSV